MGHQSRPTTVPGPQVSAALLKSQPG
jgi:hypothetical protein